MTDCLKSLAIFALICASVHAQTLSDRVDALFTKSNQKDEPGTAVLLIRDGQIEYRSGFGLADLDKRTPVTPETQFSVESVTKQFTATDILILMDQGTEIFDPLGMRDTLVVDERHQKTSHLALGYDKQTGQWRDVTYSPWNFIFTHEIMVSWI